MIKASKDLSAANAATISFFEAVATASKHSIHLGGGNIRKYLAEPMYFFLTGPSEEYVSTHMGALAVIITQLLFQQDKNPANYHIACNFVKLLRELKTKVEAGEISPKQAFDDAYLRRRGDEVEEKTVKVSAQEAEILRQFRSGELKF